MSKDKRTTLLVIKTYSFNVAVCQNFYTQSSFSVQYLFFTSVTTSHKFDKNNISGI